MKLEPANIVCPVCGNANYMRHLIGKNVGHLNLKCINCNSYFNFDELYKRRTGEALKLKPITNADRIRSMDDEELADILASMCPPAMTPTETCFYALGDGSDGVDSACDLCWLDWLKQEEKL